MHTRRHSHSFSSPPPLSSRRAASVDPCSRVRHFSHRAGPHHRLRGIMDQGQRMASSEPKVSSASTSVSQSGSFTEASNKCRKRPEVENEEEQHTRAHKEQGHQPHVAKACREPPQVQDKCLKKAKVSNEGEQLRQPQVDKGLAQPVLGEGISGQQPKSIAAWPNTCEKDKERGLNEESIERADAETGSPTRPPGFEQCDKWGQLPPFDKGGEQGKGWGQHQHVDKGGEQGKGWGQHQHVDKGWGEWRQDKQWGQQLPVLKGCKKGNGCGQQPTVEKGQGQSPHAVKGCEKHLNKGLGQNMGCGNGWRKGQLVSKGWGQCQPAEWPRVKDGRENGQDSWGRWRQEQSPSPPYGSNDPVCIAASALQEMMKSSPREHRTPSKDLEVIQTAENTIVVTENVFSIKLLIDNKGKRVLSAETGKEVIDFVFNLLALPVASLVEFITKKNMIGSMGNLYESIESIDSIYLQPNLDRSSLLKPVVASSVGNIPLLPPSVCPRRAQFYRCSNSYHYYVTNIQGTSCPDCDHKMMTECSYLAGETSCVSSTNAGYVKGGLVKYLLSDDMYVIPLSTMSTITLLKKFNMEDITFLEEKIVEFGMKEGLEVVKAALHSKSVLTEVFPWNETAPDTRSDRQPVQANMEAEDTNAVSENTSSVAEKVLSIKILIDIKARRLLFAEVEKELIDFLFSLLALPVSSLVELIKKKNMVGSVGNLYESLENLSSSYIQANVDKKSLLRPEIVLPSGNIRFLPPNIGALDTRYYVCSTKSHHSYLTHLRGTKCPSCPVGNYPMQTEMSYVASGGVSADSSTEDGYVKGEVKYVVTDELTVIPSNSVSSISLLKKYGVVDVNTLEEKTCDFGIKEGLEVLKAALTSKTVLTEVFGKKILSEME